MNAIDTFQKDDFQAFLLLWAANADSKITDEELAMMVEKSGRHAHNRAWAVFQNQSDFEHVQTIQKLKEQFFPGPDGKAEILKFIQEMLDADGKFTAAEQAYKSALARLL